MSGSAILGMVRWMVRRMLPGTLKMTVCEVGYKAALFS